MRPIKKSPNSYHNRLTVCFPYVVKRQFPNFLNLRLFLVKFLVVCKYYEFWIDEINSWNLVELDLLSLIFILPLRPKNDQQLVSPHTVNQTHHKNWPNDHESQGKLICLSLFLKIINRNPLERYGDKIRECAITVCLSVYDWNWIIFFNFWSTFLNNNYW